MRMPQCRDEKRPRRPARPSKTSDAHYCEPYVIFLLHLSTGTNRKNK
jgi:hypothetical protein